MPAWPQDNLSTDGVDQGTDKPPRAMFKSLIETVKAMLAARGQAAGVCELNDDARIPVARLPVAFEPPVARGKFLGVPVSAQNPVVGLLGGTGFASPGYQRLGSGHYKVTLAAAVPNWQSAQVERSGHLQDNFLGVPINCYADMISATEIEIYTSHDLASTVTAVDAYFTLVVWPG